MYYLSRATKSCRTIDTYFWYCFDSGQLKSIHFDFENFLMIPYFAIHGKWVHSLKVGYRYLPNTLEPALHNSIIWQYKLTRMMILMLVLQHMIKFSNFMKSIYVYITLVVIVDNLIYNVTYVLMHHRTTLMKP